MAGAPADAPKTHGLPFTRPAAAYALSLFASAVAFAIALYFHRPLAEISPFIVFYAAVAFGSWYGGFGPGLLAVALGAVAVDYYLLSPHPGFHLPAPAPLGRLLLFVAVGTLIAALNGRLLIANSACRREASAARASEARAARLAESNLIAVFFSDLNGRVHGGNDECLRLSGYSRDELLAGALNWRDLTAPEHRHLDDSCLNEIRRGRVCTPFEKDHLLRDGSRIPVLMGCAALGEPPDQCVGFIMDLTAQRRAESDARAYQERLAALSTELLEAEERERRRIATVLHDSIGQSLALARLKVESAARTNNAAAPDLGEAESLILQVIRETRRLTSELSPPVLYELGLVPALRWLAEQTHAQHGLPIELHADSDADPSTQQESIVLFETARELLRNAVRHSRATHCSITLAKANGRDHGAFRLEIRDNGVGFDTTATRFAAGDVGGFGLFNIRERLKRLGGSLSIYAQPPGGTSAIVELPFISRPRPDAAGTQHLERSRP